MKTPSPPPEPRGPFPFLATALFLFLFLALQPSSSAPVKDEGGYFRMSANLPAYGLGVYEQFDMTSTSLTLISGGYLTMAVFGASLPAARGFVLAACLLCLLISYPIFRKAGAERAAVLAFLLALAVNPLFARYAHTFTTDGIFVSLCLAALGCYAAANATPPGRRMLLAGSLLAALAIYTRQPGIVLPAVPMALLLLETARERRPPDGASGALLLLPYLAFLPLALFFHRHSGSFLVYVSKPWEHSLHGFHPNVLLWAVNFLGFFSAPFLIPLLAGHKPLLSARRWTPLLACALLGPLILLGESSIASPAGGLERIFSAASLPALLVSAVVVVCQFAGWVTLAVLGARAWAGHAPDRCFFLFAVLYAAGISTKGGSLLVHYAAPLALPAAWAAGSSIVRCGARARALFFVGLLAFAALSTVWSKAEGVLGDAIHQAIETMEAAREETDLVYTWSATALQMLPRQRLTFDPQEAEFVLVTPEDAQASPVPEGFRKLRTFRAALFGRSLGDVHLFERLPGASQDTRPEA